MKKLLLFVIAILLTFGGLSQVTPTYDSKIANATTQFSNGGVPSGSKILDINTGKLYLCLTATIGTATLTTASANFRDLGDYNLLTDKPAINDTLLTRIYQGTGTLVTGSAPNFTIKADTALVETKVLATSQLATKLNRLNAITDGYVPYQSASTHAFVNSPFFTDGTNVGIGTASPLAALDVVGFGRFQSSNAVPTGTVDGLEAYYYTTGGYGAITSMNRGTSTYKPLVFTGSQQQFFIGATEKMRIDTAGNVGIGTTVPGAKLAIVSSNVANNVIDIQQTGATGYSAIRMLDSGGIETGGFGYANASAGLTNLAGKQYYFSKAKDMVFTYDYNTAGAGMIIKNGGNVGIGTVAPYYGLDVNNNVRVRGTNSYGFGGTTGAYTDRFYSPSSGIISTGSQLQSTLATGTPPLAVTSTTVNTNLNAEYLQGHHWADIPAASKDSTYIKSRNGILIDSTGNTYGIKLDTTIAETKVLATSQLALKQNLLTNPVTGTGTSGYVSFFDGTSSITGDAGLFWHNTDKRFGIGTVVPEHKLDVVAEETTIASALQTTAYYTGGVQTAGHISSKVARGTLASPTAIQANDVMGGWAGRGYGASAFSTNSRVSARGYADENWSNTSQGTYIGFQTTTIGTTTTSEKLRIDDDGLTIGGNYILPYAAGTSGQALLFPATGTTLAWGNPTVPGGSTTQVQYNNSGVLAGSADFVWDNSIRNLYINGNIQTTSGNYFYLQGSNGQTGVQLNGVTDEEYINLKVADVIAVEVKPDTASVNIPLSVKSTITSTPTYTTTVGATNKPLFIDNTGLIGVGGINPHIAGYGGSATNRPTSTSGHYYSIDTLFTGATKCLAISDSYLFTASHDTITYTGANGHIKFEVQMSAIADDIISIGLFNITDNAQVPIGKADYETLVGTYPPTKFSLIVVDINATTNDKYIIKYANWGAASYIYFDNIFLYAELIH